MDQPTLTQEQITQFLAIEANKEDGIQEVLKLAFEAIMRSERQVHNLTHGDMSNGFRSRRFLGQGKLMELRVPRSRSGTFYPLIFSLLKNQEQECRSLAFKLYGAGLTTEQVGDLFEDLYGKKYSTSQVSLMFDTAREIVREWMERPLDSYYPLIMIDATFIPTRRYDSVSKEGYYTILGVKSDRTREVLGVFNFPTESAQAWQQVLQSLKQRGVRELGLVVCDSLTSIETAIWKEFKQAEVQLCTVHLMRNILKEVRPKDKEVVAEEFKEIFKTGDASYKKQSALTKWNEFATRWVKTYPKLKRMGQNDRFHLYFTYLEYHHKVQNMIYTTNWVERLNRDYKRVVRMRGALPNPDATLLLLGHVSMNRKAYLRKVPMINYETNKWRWDE